VKRLVFSVAIVAAAFLVAVERAVADSPATGTGTNAVHYYVALGDSLAEGYQPYGQIDDGYADQLYRALETDDPNLQLEKLACGGETTSSMISGVMPWGGLGSRYFCGYRARKAQRAHGSQLADAVAFLHAHSQSISLITIDIGGNDVGLCVYVLDQSCLADALATVEQNLPVIVSALRMAAPGVPIVAMNYYDPFLAFWFAGPADALTANQMVAGQLNPALAHVYAAYSIPVADVAGAFSTADFTLQPSAVPLNVKRICDWTWMCAIGDLHPNAAGYSVIAQAFLDVLA
jgi:lysophospholipase L1-like esterase